MVKTLSKYEVTCFSLYLKCSFGEKALMKKQKRYLLATSEEHTGPVPLEGQEELNLSAI